MKLGFSPQIFENNSNVKFRKILSSESWVVPYGRTESQTDMTKLIAAFRNFANAPKKRRVSTGFIWRTMGTSGEVLWNVIKYRYQKMRGFYWLAEWQLIYCLCSVEMVTWLTVWMLTLTQPVLCLCNWIQFQGIDQTEVNVPVSYLKLLWGGTKCLELHTSYGSSLLCIPCKGWFGLSTECKADSDRRASKLGNAMNLRQIWA
jgi:hypothetical protein